MTRTLTALCLIACGASSPERETEPVRETTQEPEPEREQERESSMTSTDEPRRRLGEIPPSSEHPAVNAVLFGTRLVIQEVGEAGAALRLTARDVFEDRVLWSVERPREGLNGHIQRFDDAHLLLNLGDRLELIAIDDGSVASSHAYRGRGRHLWSDNGVCLLNTDCSFDLLDCETAKPLHTFHIGHSRRRPLHGPHSHHSPCMGGPDIVGRAGEMLILVIDNWETDRLPTGARMRSGAHGWVGVRASDGGIVWAEPHDEGQARGASSRFAWFVDGSGVTVINARTGAVHRRIARTNVRFVFDLRRDTPSIELLLEDAVEVVELATGRAADRQVIPLGALAIHADAIYPQHLYMRMRSDEPQQYLWLGEGDPIVRTIPAGEALHPASRGEPWVVAAHPTYDSAGNAIVPGVYDVERYRVGDAGPPNRARLRQGEEVILELDHDAWSLGEIDRDQHRAVVLFVSGDDWRTDAKVYVHRSPI